MIRKEAALRIGSRKQKYLNESSSRLERESLLLPKRPTKRQSL